MERAAESRHDLNVDPLTEGVVLDSLRRGVFAALPQFAEAAAMAAELLSNHKYMFIGTDGTSVRPFSAFVEGFLDTAGSSPPLWFELPARRERRAKPDRPAIPAAEPDMIAAALMNNQSWPEVSIVEDARVLILTENIYRGGTIQRIAQAVRLASPDLATNPIDIVTAHMDFVVPLLPDGTALPPAVALRQRIAVLEAGTMLGGGNIYCPDVLGWADPSKHPALVASQGFEVALDGFKLDPMLTSRLISARISSETRHLLVPLGQDVLRAAGAAAGNAYARSCPDNVVAEAERATIELLPRGESPPSLELVMASTALSKFLH